jgi:NADH:ubiquinone oxidoreductase subunit F (NADH-binding)
LINPEDINDYVDRGGYGGFANALRMSPEEVEEEVIRSGLREETGIGLSSAGRWRYCREVDGKEKYLIAHAASADPVAMTEQALLEGDPHAILEGMLIAAYGAGANHGIVYVGSRYSMALSLFEIAHRQMEAAGYLGDGIQGSEFSFHVHFITAAGPVAYGDTEKLIAALEGRRPTACHGTGVFGETGYRGLPTVIHTVESLSRLSDVFLRGADGYAGLGANGHQGTKTLTLAGRVRRTGLIEIPMGTSLHDIIHDIGGGVPEGETFKAVQVGGPTGGWLSADALDIPIDDQTMAAEGITLGTGSLAVVTQGACAVDLARQALMYARTESCGHCLFCREGTRQMARILSDLCEGRSEPEDLDLLLVLAEGIKLNSSCSLGRTAPNAFLSLLRLFREEYEVHMKEKRCSVGICSNISGGNAAPIT